MNVYESLWLLRRTGKPEEAQSHYSQMCRRCKIRIDQQSVSAKFDSFLNTLNPISPEEARDLVVFEAATLLRNGKLEQARSLLFEIQDLSYKMNVLDSFEFSFQLGLQAGVEGDFSQALYHFKRAVQLTEIQGWRWFLAAANVIFMQEYLAADDEKDAEALYDDILRHPEVPSYSETIGQLDAYRVRKIFARGTPEDLTAIKDFKGIQCQYLAILLGEIPYNRARGSKKLSSIIKQLKTSFLSSTDGYQFSYRAETIFENASSTILAKNPRTNDVVDRIYLWLWRWIELAGLRNIKEVLKLLCEIKEFDLHRIDATSTLMLENSQNWVSIVSGRSLSSFRPPLSVGPSLQDEASILHQESRLLSDLAETIRKGQTYKDFIKKGEKNWPFFYQVLCKSISEGLLSSSLGQLLESVLSPPSHHHAICLDYRRGLILIQESQKTVPDSSLCAFLSCFVKNDEICVEELMAIVFNTSDHASEQNYRRLSKLLYKANSFLENIGTFSRSRLHVCFTPNLNAQYRRATMFFEIGSRWTKEIFYSTHSSRVLNYSDSDVEPSDNAESEPLYLNRQLLGKVLGNYNKSHVLRIISKLTQEGILSRFGNGKNTRYEVSKRVQFEEYCRTFEKQC